MTALRRRVRVVAFTWLLCQVASLSAFVPEQCCVSHAHAKAEAVAKEDGADCHQHEPAPPDGCVMKTGCEGPGTQLLRMFAFHGVLESPATSSTVLESSPAFVASPAPLIYRLASPDAPPPKA
jgi:hypothetical protein